MGKISSESQHQHTHFSHPHPLNLISHQTPPPNSSCSACKLNISGTIYSCTICRFFLHKKCFEMPRKITHPSHKDHVFDLLPQPAYADGAFNCDACNEAGAGFVYHCKPCGLDLHILCAAAPLSAATPRHPHKLQLCFESPYPDKSFRCDVCGRNGSNHWLYRCGLCGFDAHLKCVGAAAPPPPPPHAAAVPYPAVGVPAGFGGMSAAPPPPAAAYRVGPVPGAVPYAAAVNRQQSERLAQLQALIQGIRDNNAVAQGGAAGFGGGFAGAGGGGGGSGLEQWTQFMSGLNNGGFGGGGVPGFGGGGGQNFLQAVMNGGGGGGGIPALNGFGGGGGQEFLQALMNGGGGGGGIDSLQSLLGGGGGLDFLGGGGGLDFLGGIGGFF